MSNLFQELLVTSATRILPTLAASNLFFYTCYKTSGIMTWVDVGWVANHALAGILHFYFNNANKSIEAKLYLALLIFWAARLGFHLGKRCFSGPSDPRYDIIPNRLNLRKSLQSLFQFEFQAVLTTFTVIPLFFLFRNLPQTNILSLDWKSIGGIAMVSAGIIGQWIADYQLDQFKKSAKNNKKEEEKDKPLCRNGVWKYSRHPNLFFELCVWTGIAILGIRKAQPQTYLGLLGPGFLFLIMNFLSIRITEKHMSSSRKNWKEYLAETNKYFPFFKL